MALSFGYFGSPFPSQQGFSPYRMPGVSVHMPVILCMAITGYLMCWPHPILRPLLLVWVIAGVYLGRDFAIVCHYALPLALVAWAFAVILVNESQALARFGRSHVLVPALLSLGIAILQIAVAWRLTPKEKPTSSNA